MFKLLNAVTENNAQSVCCQEESVICARYATVALVLLNLQISNPVRREERGMFILHRLISHMLSFLTLVSDGEPSNDPELKFRTFCSRAMLICSIIWLGKRMLRRVVVLRVLFFVDMRLPRIQCR